MEAAKKAEKAKRKAEEEAVRQKALAEKEPSILRCLKCGLAVFQPTDMCYICKLGAERNTREEASRKKAEEEANHKAEKEAA